MTVPDESHAETVEMHLAHDMLRREFALVPALVRGVAEGDVDRAAVVADHLDLLTGLLDDHHRAEDTHLWPRLLARGPAPAVDALTSRYQGIEDVLSELGGVLATWRRTAPARTTEDLGQLLERLHVLLGEHLALEEERVLPLVEEHLTAAEWDGVVQAAGAGTPEARIPLLLGMLIHEGDPEVVEKTLAKVPATVRPAVREMSQQAYATHSERVHGTATPRREEV